MKEVLRIYCESIFGTIKFRTQIPHLTALLFALGWKGMEIKKPEIPLLVGLSGLYPGRESNPHGRNGHRILSSAIFGFIWSNVVFIVKKANILTQNESYESR